MTPKPSRILAGTQSRSSSRIVWKQSLLLIALWVVSCVCSSSLRAESDDEDEAPKVQPAEMNARVKIGTVRAGKMPVMLKAMGVFAPRQQSPASVVSRLAGIVASVEVRDGQEVTSGTVLLRLDPRAAQSALNKAKAGLRSAEADLRKATDGGLDLELEDLDLEATQAEVAASQARQESERQSALLADHLVSEKSATLARQAMEDAERRAKAAKSKAKNFKTTGRSAELARLQSAVDQARAEVALAELDCACVVIRAQQSGRIAGLKASVGGAVEANAAVAQVIGVATTVLRIYVAPRDAESVRLDNRVTAQSSSGKESLSGRIVSIGGALDPETGLTLIEAQLEVTGVKSPRIGEAVFAEIETANVAEGWIVPASAVTVEDDRAFVFKVDENQIAHALPVTILARTASEVAVAGEGLSEGPRIVVDGNYNLPDGARVVGETKR